MQINAEQIVNPTTYLMVFHSALLPLGNFDIFWLGGKVQLFWEGHKILQNLHLTFDWHYIGQK